MIGPEEGKGGEQQLYVTLQTQELRPEGPASER